MKRLGLVLTLAILGGCDDGSITAPAAPTPAPAPPPPPVAASFEVTTVNLTAAQPLSPIAVVIHDDAVRAFSVGMPASTALELLAEGGDNSELLEELAGRAQNSGTTPLGPGSRETLSLELDSEDTGGARLTVMTMLVNSNDAITGLNGIDVSDLEVGERRVYDALAYDAGTEANSEAAGSIPGPADGGEGFNAARDDLRDQVTLHGGVVTADDGLAGSVLNQNHRFDNPVARITVTRTQ